MDLLNLLIDTTTSDDGGDISKTPLQDKPKTEILNMLWDSIMADVSKNWPPALSDPRNKLIKVTFSMCFDENIDLMLHPGACIKHVIPIIWDRFMFYRLGDSDEQLVFSKTSSDGKEGKIEINVMFQDIFGEGIKAGTIDVSVQDEHGNVVPKVAKLAV